MHDNDTTPEQIEFSATDNLKLEPNQVNVIDLLNDPRLQEYPLGNWYLGALYTAKNSFNPDRFSQAAHSLRELLEKLPRAFNETENQVQRPDFKGMRDVLYSRLCSDKSRYQNEWVKKKIDEELNTTIRVVDTYLEASQKPERGEQISLMFAEIDPMYDTLDTNIQLEKSKRFQGLWENLQRLTHHGGEATEEFLNKQINHVEHLIIDLLAPITAQNQGVIEAILKKEKPEQADFDKLFSLIGSRGANYTYFFKTVDNPIWIGYLKKKKVFDNPRNMKTSENGQSITMPIWWPISYLERVSNQAPEEVVEIVCGLETDNPRILREVFSIACNLEDINLSLRLKPLIVQYLKSSDSFHMEEKINIILKKWGSSAGVGQDAAHEIIKYVISFQSDPDANTKRARRKENPKSFNTHLEPIPRFDRWEYNNILGEGVRAVADSDPYTTAVSLIRAVNAMIDLGVHEDELKERKKSDYPDFSTIWCKKLNEPDSDYSDVKEILTQTLTYACEQVYKEAPEYIDKLDQKLRHCNWTVFNRLRQHLYASYPNDQTLLWIQECITDHKDYSTRKHYYEFQLMIRKACEHFGSNLLNKDEQKTIFDAIRSGPSKEDYQQHMGDQYDEGEFLQYQQQFHREQLHPFAKLLSGDLLTYFNELESNPQNKAITDDDYLPYSRGTVGSVRYQSPKSTEDFVELTDEEILAYLNDWNDQHRDENDRLVEINFSALADTFQSLFKETIMPNGKRLSFWLTNCDKITRPIYVKAMVKAMRDIVKEKKFDDLDQWIEFCAWVLKHQDSTREEEKPEPREESSDHPDWGSSRRAVVDLIDECVNKDTNAPIAVRGSLANLLQQACNQLDSSLDFNQRVFTNNDDPVAEGINNTRSLAIESLIHFSFWIRRHLPEDDLPELPQILNKRIAEGAEFPLTRPEYALLGIQLSNICTLNKNWVIQQKRNLFPVATESIRSVVFSSYIRFNHSNRALFEILRDEYEFAIENLHLFSTEREDWLLVGRLGIQLFLYYLWGLYPLTGDESLLQRFYDKTKDDRKHWVHLFDDVARLMRRSNGQAEKLIIDRTKDFFEWRFEAADSVELSRFSFWLEAECLDPVWRLSSYSKIIDLVNGEEEEEYININVRALNKFLPDHLALVVECLTKITVLIKPNNPSHFFVTDDVINILKAGRKSHDQQIKRNVERAVDKLALLGLMDPAQLPDD